MMTKGEAIAMGSEGNVLQNLEWGKELKKQDFLSRDKGISVDPGEEGDCR